MGRIFQQRLRAREFASPGSSILSNARVDGGDVCIFRTGAKIGQKDRKVLGGRLAEPITQVGVVHLVFDDAKCDSRVTADDQDLADRVAWIPAGRGCGGPTARAS